MPDGSAAAREDRPKGRTVRAPRWQRRIPLAGLAAVLSATFLVTAGPPANAVISTCGTPGPWFVGYAGPGTTGAYYEGAAADITVRNTANCTTDTDPISNFSNSWAMIAGGDMSGEGDLADGWAQVGFERGASGSLKHFGQQTSDRTYADLVTRYSVGSPSSGQSFRYSNNWIANCYCLKSYIDTTVWIQSDWNPFEEPWTAPFSPQFVAESAYRENDVPGYASTGPTLYSNVQGQNYSNQWVNMPCGLVNSNDSLSSNPWVAASTACNALRTYTNS